MKIDQDFKSFCDLYYKDAERIADITIAEHVKKHGRLNRFIDVDLVKDLGISYGLEKVFNNYDVDHESRASLMTYMSRVLRNCVLKELAKESTAVRARERTAADIGADKDSRMSGKEDEQGRFWDYIDAGGKQERKEELINRTLQCLKRLNGVDQVILRCWMLYPKGEYTNRVLEELQWEDGPRTRNVVSVRCHNALEKLRKMLDQEENREIFVHISCAEQIATPDSEPRKKPADDYNFVRRRRRAARKSIASGIDYDAIAHALASGNLR